MGAILFILMNIHVHGSVVEGRNPTNYLLPNTCQYKDFLYLSPFDHNFNVKL